MFNYAREIGLVSDTYVAACDGMCQGVSRFMNRCDYLDPALAWTGVKDSGRGCSLSRRC